MLQLYLQLLNTCSEQEKFKQLYETYHRLMHWEAQRVLQDRQLAEDAVQESFLRMIKNFQSEKFLVPKQSVSWLLSLGTPRGICSQRRAGCAACRPLA